RGLNIHETLILREDVNDMDEAFISSTGVGVLPVVWEGFKSNYHLSQILAQDLLELFESGG
ncbi:hypothetical protein HQ531_00490, partial [bacterium]|nr:hypothetical protein [bacterium]